MSAYLELVDWRRRVAALFATWRADAPRDPVRATEAFRASRAELFRDHPQSPLPPAERAPFRSLEYWPYDPAWRMTVRLIPAEDGVGDPHAETEPAGGSEATGGAAIALPSSGPGALAYRRVGSMELGGPLTGLRLSIFWIEGYGNGLFLPFRDATSGAETYGAGRYLLDTVKSADHGGDPERGELLLDFNLAFHPSCAYDPRWICPLAPPENRLPVPVRVGERLRA